MEFKKRIIVLGALGALLLPTFAAISGCSSNATIQEDPAATAKRVDAAGKMRSFFDKSHGNYDSLSDADKAALNALTGSEQHSREAFGHMFNPTGGPGTRPAETGGH